MDIAFKIEDAANKASAFSSLLQATTEVAFNGTHKTKEYEASFNFLCIMASEHAEYMKELEEEAFAIAKGEMAAGGEVENNVEMASGTPSYGL